MSQQNKSSKRTFGLVSGYGSDTESEDSDTEEVTKKQKVGDNGEKEVTRDISDQNDDEEEIPETKAPSASWMRARREYEESAMLYSFICSADDDEHSENNGNDKTDEQDVESNEKETGKTIDVQDSNIAETNAVERDEDGESVKPNETEDQDVTAMEKTKEILVKKDTDNCETALVAHDDKAIMEKSDTAVMENQEKAVIENHDRDWEIEAIQAEIDTQQKDWEPVYSDDEGAGAEDAAVFKIAKKRAVIIKDLEKEMVRPMNRPAAKIVPENHVPGEGWKRLQLRAETRVKNFPELYQTYPVHKFPLRD